MALTQEQYKQLSDYLDGRMTPQEEAAYVQLLSADAELQREHDFELLLRASLENEEEPATVIDPAFEPAEKHLQKAAAVLQNQPAGNADTGGAKVVSLKPSYRRMVSIAALFVLMLAALVFYFTRHPQPKMANTPPLPRNDTVLPKRDTIRRQLPVLLPDSDEQVVIATPLTPAEAYTENYKRFQETGEEPAALRPVYNAYYYDRDYAEVSAAAEGDYGTKGGEDSTAVLYIKFYKALSLLENGKPTRAIAGLKSLLAQTAAGTSLHAFVQWYLAMAFLKAESSKEAKKTLQAIAVSGYPSPYKTKAVVLLKKLA